jgi:hypothetical protein
MLVTVIVRLKRSPLRATDGLALLAGCEDVLIIGGVRRAVRADPAHVQRRGLPDRAPPALDLRQGERVVGSPELAVGAGRQVYGARQVADAQAGTDRRTVGHEQLRTA